MSPSQGLYVLRMRHCVRYYHTRVQVTLVTLAANRTESDALHGCRNLINSDAAVSQELCSTLTTPSLVDGGTRVSLGCELRNSRQAHSSSSADDPFVGIPQRERNGCFSVEVQP